MRKQSKPVKNEALKILYEIEHELRQRHMDMYVDCDKESIDLLTDVFAKKFRIVEKALKEE